MDKWSTGAEVPKGARFWESGKTVNVDVSLYCLTFRAGLSNLFPLKPRKRCPMIMQFRATELVGPERRGRAEILHFRAVVCNTWSIGERARRSGSCIYPQAPLAGQFRDPPRFTARFCSTICSSIFEHNAICSAIYIGCGLD